MWVENDALGLLTDKSNNDGNNILNTVTAHNVYNASTHDVIITIITCDLVFNQQQIFERNN